MMIKFRAFSLRKQGQYVAMPAWQRYHAGVATLSCRRGNVVMPAWQRYYAGMATHGVPCKNHYTAYRNENVLYRNGYIVLITKILEKEIRQTPTFPVLFTFKKHWPCCLRLQALFINL